MDFSTDYPPPDSSAKSRRKSKKEDQLDDGGKKRRCISSACVPCRKRKSKVSGLVPPVEPRCGFSGAQVETSPLTCFVMHSVTALCRSCSACKAVHNTECVYDPNSDHRRKGVYKKDIDNLKTRNSTLQILIQAILNYPEDEVAGLIQQIRTCESLDTVAETIIAKENGHEEEDEPVSPMVASAATRTFESQLSGKMGELRLEAGSTRYIGGTSHLIYLDEARQSSDSQTSLVNFEQYPQSENPTTSWTTVTSDPELILHLINMYFCWHYTFFTTLSKTLFFKEFQTGKPPPGSRRKTEYCTPLLVNAMLALGCHFTSHPGARAIRDDSATAGDHFFKEAKRLILEDDLHEVPALTTVQALALMSVREAGCGREAKGWVYSGMSFRMACDLGLNLDMHSKKGVMDENEEDARRITFWGCFLFDKCWSNYLGRLPQLPNTMVTIPKFDVFPVEESDTWSAYTDSGFSQAHAQPSRTRAVALQISRLCEISSDIMNFFYNPIDMDKAKGKQAELKKLSEIHQRLETWRRELPKELEPKEGGLPSMLVMHMFFQLLYVHLFRPFLKYSPENSPLPAHVSPRKLCTTAAQMISKLLRLYKRSHGLRQICNIAVYIGHSACTIHLLNLPEKNAKRDIIHGVKHLEEIAEGWLCARRTLGILSILAREWKIDLPEEAATVLARTDAKFGRYNEASTSRAIPSLAETTLPQTSPQMQPYTMPMPNAATPQFFNTTANPLISSEAIPPHRGSEARSLPPNDSNPLAYPRAQRQNPDLDSATPAASTPANHRQSFDGTPTSASSPSALFGGVEQLLREGQDWWLRDQSQLAMGFDNWNLSAEEMAWLNTSPQAIGSPAMAFPGSPQVVDAAFAGGPVNGAVGSGSANPGANGGVVSNGVNGFAYQGYEGALNSYNEQDWYA